MSFFSYELPIIPIRSPLQKTLNIMHEAIGLKYPSMHNGYLQKRTCVLVVVTKEFEHDHDTHPRYDV